MTDEKKERLELNDLPVEEELSEEEQKQTKGGVPNISTTSTAIIKTSNAVVKENKAKTSEEGSGSGAEATESDNQDVDISISQPM